jgi:GNAT superfamily N-acetyltransferase
MPVQIILEENPLSEDVKTIYKELLAFNTGIGGAPENKPILVLLRDTGTGETLGGVHGVCFYGWLYITMFFIPGDLRKKGYGTKLLAKAETYARQQGSHGIWLDTFSFQAPGFYEKAGYEKFGELPNFPTGHSRIFYRKIL